MFLPLSGSAQESAAGGKGYTLPRWGIKTNLLYDATATMNLAVEFRTGARTSLDLSAGYNPWTIRRGDNMKWKHILVQPEFRWWLDGTFDGLFFGAHAHWAYYNVGTLPAPPFSRYMNDRRFQGWLAGAGASMGYRWNFNHRWGLEATLGLGYAYFSYDIFACERCGERIGGDEKHYLVPTKLGVSIILGLGGGKRAKTPKVPLAPFIPSDPEPVESVTPVTPVTPVTSLTPPVPAAAVTEVTPLAAPHPPASPVSIPDGATVLHESGSALIDFACGSRVLSRTLNRNAGELGRIEETLRRLMSNPDATVTRITVTGYASPEGTYADNFILSERRAHALKRYIAATYNLPESVWSVAGAGEDWDGLERLVEVQERFAGRERVLDIIRGVGIFEGRELRLMNLSGGRPYRTMRAELFPQLRRVEYRIEYIINKTK